LSQKLHKRQFFSNKNTLNAFALIVKLIHCLISQKNIFFSFSALLSVGGNFYCATCDIRMSASI
jgi:hypothetical protein